MHRNQGHLALGVVDTARLHVQVQEIGAETTSVRAVLERGDQSISMSMVDVTRSRVDGFAGVMGRGLLDSG